MRRYGDCQVCGGSFQVKKDGTIRHHAGQRVTFSGRHEYRCKGVGQPPKSIEETPCNP